jgi:hypothetical protein
MLIDPSGSPRPFSIPKRQLLVGESDVMTVARKEVAKTVIKDRPQYLKIF